MDKYINQYINYLKEKGIYSATINQYKQRLEKFLEITKVKRPKEINRLIIRKFQGFLAHEKNNYLTNTQNYYLITLRNFLKFLEKNNIKSLNYKEIKLFKHQTSYQPLLEKNEINQIFSAVKKTSSHLIIKYRDLALLEVLLSTNLKVSEISNLTRNDFAYKKIHLSNQALFALKNYLDKRKDDSKYLFVRHDHAAKKDLPPLTARSIQRMVERYTKKANINKNITPESFRQH
ncbi:MAG: tyrosine-type recombinase/integrase [Patescibacteria group bacterium]|nr:tyrosine-type recombinase/integrase [Patescibacteria group bacterium]